MKLLRGRILSIVNFLSATFFLLFTIFIYLKPVLTLIDVFYFINTPQILSGSLLSPKNDQYQFSPNNIST